MSTFSQRHGYQPPEPPITIRDQAPDWLRDFIVSLAYQAGLSASSLRSILCDLLLESPDPNNWSEPNIDNEVFYLIRKAEWFQVYDFVEEVVEALQTPTKWDREKFEHFIVRLNDAFRRKGVGWQLLDGKIQIRGEESFDHPIKAAIEATAATSRPVAENEFRAAVHDLSKRPNPDITGAIRHAMAALECVAPRRGRRPKRDSRRNHQTPPRFGSSSTRSRIGKDLGIFVRQSAAYPRRRRA